MDALIEQGERFANVAGFQNPADAERTILISILLGQEVDRQALEARVDELEERIEHESG